MRKKAKCGRKPLDEESPSRITTLRIPVRDMEEARATAKANKMSQSEFIRDAIQRSVAENRVAASVRPGRVKPRVE